MVNACMLMVDGLEWRFGLIALSIKLILWEVSKSLGDCLKKSHLNKNVIYTSLICFQVHSIIGPPQIGYYVKVTDARFMRIPNHQNF